MKGPSSGPTPAPRDLNSGMSYYPLRVSNVAPDKGGEHRPPHSPRSTALGRDQTGEQGALHRSDRWGT